MPNEDDKISKYNYGEKSLKVPFMIYVGLECLLKILLSSQNNKEKSKTERKAKHTRSGWAMFMKCSFDATKNKRDYCRGRDSVKKLCKELRNRTMEIINYEQKEMVPLTDKEIESNEKQGVCHICKKEFCFDGATHNICNFSYEMPKEIPVVIHNATYDTHFIIRQLPQEFEGQFKCLGENTEKYITFSVPIKKELDNSKTITYKLKFIDSFRFMSTSLSSLTDNLSEIYKKECKGCKERRKIDQNVILLGLKIINYAIKKNVAKASKRINKKVFKYT